MKNRRLGKFYVADYWINKPPKGKEFHRVLALLDFIPLRVEHMFESQSFEYTGTSSHFSELKVGEMIPLYKLDVMSDKSGVIDKVSATS